MGDLGKVMLTNGGTWNSATTYEPLTMVRHNKASYCSTQNSVGQEPSETSAYWQLVAKDGNEVTVDSELSETSTNTVQNRVVTSAIKALGAPVLIQDTEPDDKTALWVKG